LRHITSRFCTTKLCSCKCIFIISFYSCKNNSWRVLKFLLSLLLRKVNTAVIIFKLGFGRLVRFCLVLFQDNSFFLLYHVSVRMVWLWLLLLLSLSLPQSYAAIDEPIFLCDNCCFISPQYCYKNVVRLYAYVH
jgi:hypothetical protein